jgi:RND superfamily putative drug exporter
MTRLLTLPATPKGKWVVFFVWIVAIGFSLGAKIPEKFADAQENDSRSFLPGDAESTAALDITEKLAGSETAPTVIVYRREGGLTAADRQAIEEDIAELNRETRAFSNTTPFGNPQGPDADTPFQVSENGSAAIIGNVIRSTGTGNVDEIIDPVDKYRELVSESPPEGLAVKVTGPSGIAADAIKVFSNINGTLAAAALSLVVFLLIFIYRSPVFWFFAISAVIARRSAPRPSDTA